MNATKIIQKLLPETTATNLLKKQHKKVKAALDEMSEAEKVDVKKLRQVADELVAHMVIEEHIFYPAVKSVDKDIVIESFEEHAVARFELQRALAAKGDDQQARVKVLKELIEHHVKEEEEELFPKVDKALSKAKNVALAKRMQKAFDKAVADGANAHITKEKVAKNGPGTKRAA